MSTWQLQTAKARLSEVLRRAKSDGPQTITLHGHAEAMVLSVADYRALKGEAEPPKTALDIFRPIWGLGLDLDIGPRHPSGGRDVDFEGGSEPDREE